MLLKKTFGSESNERVLSMGRGANDWTGRQYTSDDMELARFNHRLVVCTFILAIHITAMREYTFSSHILYCIY